MKKGFVPMTGAGAWQLSNAPVLGMAAHKAALEIFDETGMDALRQKSEQLTGYLEFLIDEVNQNLGEQQFLIITPREKHLRGCQLSLIAKSKGKEIYDNIVRNGIAADWREPDVIRVAPVPLYNTFEDVYKFAEVLKEVFILG